MVRCKFHCQEKVTRETGVWHGGNCSQGISYSYKFIAVTNNSEENNKFFASTPSGIFDVQTVRNDLFVPGKDYYIDISEA